MTMSRSRPHRKQRLAPKWCGNLARGGGGEKGRRLAPPARLGRRATHGADDVEGDDDPARDRLRFGELGKHGSLINPEFGSSFRLSAVLTDAPFAPTQQRSFGVDSFCASCRICGIPARPKP